MTGVSLSSQSCGTFISVPAENKETKQSPNRGSWLDGADAGSTSLMWSYLVFTSQYKVKRWNLKNRNSFRLKWDTGTFIWIISDFVLHTWWFCFDFSKKNKKKTWLKFSSDVMIKAGVSSLHRGLFKKKTIIILSLGGLHTGTERHFRNVEQQIWDMMSSVWGEMFMDETHVDAVCAGGGGA